MKKQFLILSIFAALLMSIFFVSCEKEETNSNALNSDIVTFSTTKSSCQDYRTPYCYPDANGGGLDYCDFPESTKCVMNEHEDIIYVDEVSGIDPRTPFGHLFQLLEQNKEPNVISQFMEDNYEDMIQEIDKKYVDQVIMGDLFLKHIYKNKIHTLVFKESLKETDRESLVFVRQFVII